MNISSPIVERAFVLLCTYKLTDSSKDLFSLLPQPHRSTTPLTVAMKLCYITAVLGLLVSASGRPGTKDREIEQFTVSVRNAEASKMTGFVWPSRTGKPKARVGTSTTTSTATSTTTSTATPTATTLEQRKKDSKKRLHPGWVR